MNFLDLIWLIPLFPLFGAALMLLFGKILDPQPPSEVAVAPGRRTHARRARTATITATRRRSRSRPHATITRMTTATGHGITITRRPAGADQASLPGHGAAVLHLLGRRGMQLSNCPSARTRSSSSPGSPACRSTWPTAIWRRFSADWGFLLDPLSSVMILVVTGIGFLIHVYSTGYMDHDNGYYRFFGYLNLFVFFMLMLVLANNYALLFVGWEGVGLCSYLLIGFYFHKKSAGDAGKKAFIVNRVGDAGFILGMLLMLSVLGTVRFIDVNAVLRSGQFPRRDRGVGLAELDRAAAVHRRHGKIGAVSAVRLAAGRHGRPHARLRPDPCGHHGHGGRLHGGALERAVPADAADVRRSWRRWAHSPRSSPPPSGWCRTISSACSPTRPSASFGYMFLALGRGRILGRGLPPVHARVLQSPALPWLGLGDSRHGRRAGYAAHGRLKDKIPITHWTMWVGSVAIAGIPGLAASSPRTRFCGRPTARRRARRCSGAWAWPPPA